jgi:ABC-type Fe3+-hydroxamate transport system substrate-binding protein
VKISCELLGNSFELAGTPRRIVSLVSAATETLADLGCRERLIGVSPYCSRYVEHLGAPVVGDYVRADLGGLRALEPDLVLLTAGVQLPLARRCAAAGLPAYALPVPASRFGILENIVTVGALVDRIGPARALAGSIEAAFESILGSRGTARPRVYVELWFGRHPRTTGGRTFIHDLVEIAGGENVFGSRPEGYLPLDLAATAAARPEVVLFFSEPEYPVDHVRLIEERGWDAPGGPRAIVSTVARGTNIIHDGPSFSTTAAWLARQMRGGFAGSPGASAEPGAVRCGRV